MTAASINRTREVYFVRAASVGLIKIGVANTALGRIESLRTMSPVPLELIGVVVCNRSGRLERELHERFAGLRAHGEWFRAEPALLEYIAENAVSARPPHEYLPPEERAAYERREAHFKDWFARYGRGLAAKLARGRWADATNDGRDLGDAPQRTAKGERGHANLLRYRAARGLS